MCSLRYIWQSLLVLLRSSTTIIGNTICNHNKIVSSRHLVEWSLFTTGVHTPFLALTLMFCTILPIKIFTSLRLDHGLSPIKISNKTVPLNPRLIFHPFSTRTSNFGFTKEDIAATLKCVIDLFIYAKVQVFVLNRCVRSLPKAICSFFNIKIRNDPKL